MSPATALGVPNFTIADTNGTGSVEVYNGPKNGATINLLIDDFGYFGPPTSPVNTVALKATPNEVLNNGTSTSAITATVDGPSGYLLGDSVSVALVGTPAAACGTILPASAVTNAAGIASFTYTSSTTVGFCAITATEAAQGAKGSATVDQVTVVPGSSSYAITVVVSPATIPANVGSAATRTSSVTATVTGVDTAPISGDMVQFSLVGANCGTLSSNFAPTTSTGSTAALTYTASDTPGTCTVDVQEANQAQVNSTVITQTPVGYVVALVANPTHVTAGGGTPNSTLTATVTYNGLPAANDTVHFVVGTSEPTGACGTVTTVGVATNASGVATVTYVGAPVSTDIGFCPITATETTTGAAATTYVTETSPSSTSNNIGVVGTPGTIPASGSTPTSAVSATVTGATLTGVPGDEVMFSLSGPTGVCGAFSSSVLTITIVGGVAFAPTLASGITPNGATAATGLIYTPTTVPGTCTVTATEANSGVSNTTAIIQSPVVYTIAVAATPLTLTGNGITTSTITATVTNTLGLPAGGDTVTFTGTGNPTATCAGHAELSAGGVAITNPAGVATLTYTTTAGAGFCTISGEEGTTSQTGSTTIDQTSV